jgi:hypothetical protein
LVFIADGRKWHVFPTTAANASAVGDTGGAKGMSQSVRHVVMWRLRGDTPAQRRAARAYATHPEHLRVRAELGDLRIARHQVDYLPER